MSAKKKVLFIFGTRPEAIKMAPLVKIFRKDKQHFNTVVCITGQHREMLDQVLRIFNISADVDLNLMTENQTLDGLTARAMTAVTKVLEDEMPGLVFVQGDTTTAMVAALAAFYKKIPVAHVEAGLRTYDMMNPFPEEANRRIISQIAAYHLAPTEYAAKALLREGVAKERVIVTGNTVVDALQSIEDKLVCESHHYAHAEAKRYILVTAHRRENFGKPLEDICRALIAISQKHEIDIVYPVHRNPNVRDVVQRLLSDKKRIHLMPPVEYTELMYLLKNAYFVLTDSGGIQEEAPTFGKPILVLRIETERPEGIKAGVARLVGTDTKNIIREAGLLLTNQKHYTRMATAGNPYGDGKASERIHKLILAQK